MYMMTNIIQQLSNKAGINQLQATKMIGQVSRAALKNVDENTRTKILASLPSEVTSLFPQNEKNSSEGQQKVNYKEVFNLVNNQEDFGTKNNADGVLSSAIEILEQHTGIRNLIQK